MTSESAPQPGAPQQHPQAQEPARQMQAQQPPRPKAPGFAPAFGDGSGAAWVFRDLASI